VAKDAERPGDDRSRAPAGRSRAGVYVAAAALSLALVGLGVGIGALVWSGDSTTKTTEATAVNNAAAAGGKGTASYTEGADIRIVSGIPGPNFATMTLSAGSDTNCTKNETGGNFNVIDGSVKVITMLVRSNLTDGSCFFQASWHTWKVSLPGGGGELGIFEQKGGDAPNFIKWYEAQCQPHWTGGWSCRDDSNYGQASDHKFWLTKTS
jgi:hypothetical protein